MRADLHVVPERRTGDPKETAASPIRVVLADDHRAMRRSIRLLLDGEDGMEVVAEAGDLSLAKRHVQEHHPHVLILDLQMCNGSSVALIHTLRQLVPETEIVVLTMEAQAAFAQQALRAGAIGYVLKDHADTDLALAVRRAHRGQRFVSAQVTARLEVFDEAIGEDGLTAREVEVLRLTALGHTGQEIARILQIALRTVEAHRANIHRKLGIRTRAELVRYALDRGLLDR